MTDAVPILAALVALVAVVVRAPRWGSPESRPLTAGLALGAVWALLRAPVLNRAADRFTEPATQLERLPDLVADVSLIAAGGLIVVAIAQAWARPRLIRGVYLATAAAEALLLVIYDPNGAHVELTDAQKWILASFALIGNSAILIAATLAYQSVPTRYRLPLSLFMIGGAFGVIAAIVRAAFLLMPDRHLGDYRGFLGGFTLLAYAIGALIGSTRTERQHHRGKPRHRADSSD